MKIEPYSDMDSWPHCKATIKGERVEEHLWEFVLPVPIPEKLWDVRARWTVGLLTQRDLERTGGEVATVVADGLVEKIVVRGKTLYAASLDLDINCPGPPFKPHENPNRERQDRILDHITPDDHEVNPGICWYCEEEVPEDAHECPDCGSSQSREAPTVGELVEKYGPDARVFVYFHDRSISLNVAYTLDDDGLAREKAEQKAKYDAEMIEYEELRELWESVATKVNEYNAMKTEAEERAKLEELKAKYDG